MQKMISWLQKNCTDSPVSAGRWIGGISPHDDYLYAGKVYYPLFAGMRTREIIVFGVTHGSVRRVMGNITNRLIFESYAAWQGPWGQVRISPLRSRLKQNLPGKQIMISNRAHGLEHSIEALIPFAQYFNRQIRITPVMVTAMDLNTMNKLSDQTAEIIAAYARENHLQLGRDLFLLISADANHYGTDFENTPFGTDQTAHRKALACDRQLIAECISGPFTSEKTKKLYMKLQEPGKNCPAPLWCGKYSIPFGMMCLRKVAALLAPQRRVKGKLLSFSDTFSNQVLPVKNTSLGITAPFSLKHWVSFFSCAFMLDK